MKCAVWIGFLLAALVYASGCIPAGTIPVGGGTGAIDDGGNGGEGGDGGGGDGDGDGDGGGVDGGDDGNAGNGGDGGGDGGADGVVPPQVVIIASELSPGRGELFTLICSLEDDGGDPAVTYQFDSTLGGAEITQNGSDIATAIVFVSPQTVMYTCTGINSAGEGQPSPPVTVSIGP